MSGYELQNETVLSWRQKAASDWETVTSPGSLFRSTAAATGNGPVTDGNGCVAGTIRASVEAKRWRQMERA